MFKRLFGTERIANRKITDALYSEIVAAARQPAYYSAWNVPDTPLGRFEMLALHMFLFLFSGRNEHGAVRDIQQQVTDEFFSDVDHSLRELGIGDLGIPKRMKKLARMFYGRAATYGDALERGDRAALAEALTRNVRPDSGPWAEADDLAGYVMAAARHLASQPGSDILAGRINFPAPEGVLLGKDAA